MNLRTCLYPQYRNFLWTFPIHRNSIYKIFSSRSPPWLRQGSPALLGLLFIYRASPPVGTCGKHFFVWYLKCIAQLDVYTTPCTAWSTVWFSINCRVGCESIGS